MDEAEGFADKRIELVALEMEEPGNLVTPKTAAEVEERTMPRFVDGVSESWVCAAREVPKANSAVVVVSFILDVR